jgi:DNA-binding CsgD family transcriptional regulator
MVLRHRRRAVGRLAGRSLHLEPLVSEAARLLRTAIGFDGWCFLTMDPATMVPTRRFKDDQFGPEHSPQLAHNEFLEVDVLKFVDLARSRRPVGVLSDVTGGAPHQSARYRTLLEPLGYGDELRAVMVHSGSCWGALQLFRETGGPHFTVAEAEFMASVSAVLAEAIKRALLVAEAEADQSENAPGVLVLDAANEIEASTGAAERWLAELRDPVDNGAPLPTVVYVLAERARAARSTSEASDSPARARVRVGSGTWLSLYASLPAEGPPGRVVIVIEPARPAEIAPLIAQAYGLSKGELRVAHLVMAGLSTEDVARALFLSPYTIQDHLKSIFDKVGVRSRRELVAQVFFRHYLPRLADDALPSATGWYT